jgi:5'-3' exonuclease
VEEYGIHPTNFAIARAMAGDKSDNIEGVAGIGLKTVSKNFPFLS